jgi:hypothetical protein
VVLVRTLGGGACLLGRSWGYDDAGVWVTDGCSGEFVVAAAADQAAPEESAGEAEPTVVAEDEQSVPQTRAPSNETWGTFDPGKGFLVGRSKLGELSISGYALVRYIDQVDDDGIFVDHLGNVRPVDGRQDIYSHRVLVWLNGWMGSPKLRYTIAFWTVNTTDQDAIFGNLGYQFHRAFNLYVGVFGNPGSRSLQGSHPYWLGHDRVLADEFFRPFFTQGIWANGEIADGLWYSFSGGNTSSTLGTTAVDLDRNLTWGGSFWWMPTTHEFGPRGAYGDWEWHEEVATRFGASATYSPEQRYTSAPTTERNTALRLADSVNLFATGSLAPGVTISDADYRVVAVDAGVKYRGIFLQVEYYYRWLDNFRADGPLPTGEIQDQGFYAQAAFFPIRRWLELYGATSQIFGDTDAGFGYSSEYILGLNFYPFDTRNHRLNFQYIDINRSPVSSTFGYYTAGIQGYVLSVAASIFF